MKKTIKKKTVAKFAPIVSKTNEQCEQEAKALRKMKPRVRRFSAFNDDHYPQIDAQLEVLIHDLTSDEIYSRYGHDSDVEGAALDARNWIDGVPDTESPTEGWKPLVK